MRAWLIALTVVVVIALGIGTGVGCYFWGESGAYDRGYVVGYGEGYVVGYGEAHDIAWSEGYSVGYDAGWAVRQAEPLALFKSVWELKEWLSQDDTDSMTYTPDTFDCDDFAITLARNAGEDGYFIGVFRTEDGRHFKNFAYIEDEADVIYLIEPQTDRVSIPPMRLD